MSHAMFRRAHLLLAFLAALTGTTVVDAATAQAEPAAAVAPAAVEVAGRSEQTEDRREPIDPLDDAFGSSDTIRVIVSLDTAVAPEPTLTGWQEIVDRRAAITADQSVVARALAASDSRVETRYTIAPMLTAEVTRDGLATLRRLPGVTSISEDVPVPVMLDGTAGIVQAPDMWSAGHDGSGWAVAVLDTGVEKTHPMFSDGAGGSRVISEACYSTNNSIASSLCPGGVTSSTAPGSGVNCLSTVRGCDHGTHVAGIAAGGQWSTGGTTISGIAPAAGIIAMQVFSRFNDASLCTPSPAPCAMSYSSNQLSALQRVQTLAGQGTRIASVNMSLGGGRYYSSCDASSSLTGAIESLRTAGIATVIAAGNSGFSDSVGSPACISSAVTVGSTTNSDRVSSFSNTHPSMVDLYAPGSSILSAIPTGAAASYSGTSMAAPHVAGAWALMRDADPDASVTAIQAALQSTGAPVGVRENGTALGFTHPRINIADAADVGSGTVLSVQLAGSGTGTVTSTPTGIDCGSACAVVVTTSPAEYTLTATPAAGSTFTSWTGCDTSNGTTCTVTVTTTMVAVTATFSAAPPENDAFADATTITVGTLTQSTFGATDEPSEPGPSCDALAANSVWFTWTPAVDTAITIDTIGSDYDAVLTAHTGSNFTELSEVDGACDIGTFDGGFTDASISFTGLARVAYRIQVTGYEGVTGQLVLNVAGTVATRRLTVATSGSGSVTTDVGGIDCGDTCSADIISGTLVTLTATPIGGHVFTGWTGACATIVPTITCTLSMTIDRTTTAVFKAVLPNDDFGSASALPAPPVSLSTTTEGSSTQTGEPIPSCGAIRSTVWFTLTPAGNTTVEFNLAGSGFDTMIAVWTGSSFGSLAEIGCNDDHYENGEFVSLQSRLTVDLVAGVTHHIQVGGFSGLTGSLEVSVTEVAPNPAYITVTAAGSGTGSVTTSAGAGPCSSAVCTFATSVGSEVTLTATADSRSIFLGWTGACTGASTCTISAIGTVDVGAVFARIPDPSENLRAVVGSATVSVTPVANASCRSVIPTLPAGLGIDAVGSVSGVPQAAAAFREYMVLSWAGDCAAPALDATVRTINIVVTTPIPPAVTLLTDSQVASLASAPGAVSVPSVPSGGSVTVAYPAGSFGPIEWVVFVVHSAPVVIGSALSGTDGSLSAVLAIDPTVAVGSHNLVAMGTVSGGAIRTPITVTSTPTPTPVFTSVTPARVLDTRSGVGAPAGRVGALDGSGSALTLQIAGRGGVPSSGVSAVALNVTVVDGRANDFGGFVTVYPCGTRPDASNLNFISGQTVPNAVIAPLSASGSVCLYVYGTAHLLVDVSGYVTSGFAPLTPVRLLDTRSTGTRVGALDGSGRALEVQIAGRGAVPSSGVSAVALNVTVVDGRANDFGGFVTVFPCGTRPDASNLNFISGQTVPNAVIAPLSATGTVCLYVYGTAHLLVDVSGFFESGFSSVTPSRLLDSRSTGTRIGALDGTGRAVEVQVAGRAGVPAGATAAALNVTVVDGRANDFGGFVTVFPCGTRPDASNLNFISGQTVPNAVIAPLSSSGSVCLYVYGTAHLLVDISGHL